MYYYDTNPYYDYATREYAQWQADYSASQRGELTDYNFYGDPANYDAAPYMNFRGYNNAGGYNNYSGYDNINGGYNGGFGY